MGGSRQDAVVEEAVAAGGHQSHVLPNATEVRNHNRQESLGVVSDQFVDLHPQAPSGWIATVPPRDFGDFAFERRPASEVFTDQLVLEINLSSGCDRRKANEQPLAGVQSKRFNFPPESRFPIEIPVVLILQRSGDPEVVPAGSGIE